MGQTTSCGGKRMKKSLSCGSAKHEEVDEPPFKKRKNSRRNSRIFPTISAEKENEANNSAVGFEQTFNVEGSPPAGRSEHGACENVTTDHMNHIELENKEEKQYTADSCAIDSYESSPIHEMIDKVVECAISVSCGGDTVKLEGVQMEGEQVECEDTQDPAINDDMLLIERNQLNILSRLANLQKEVQGIADEVGVVLPTYTLPSKPESSTETGVSILPQNNGGIHDIVVSADPANPPLSLFVLYEMLKARYKLIGRVHVHSSLSILPDHLKTVFDNKAGTQRSEYEIAVTLIWRKVEFGPTLMVSGHSQSPIIGESNILRYLGRLLQPAYDVGDALTATLVDEWIDTAHYQILKGKPRERTSAMKLLNVKLGLSDWLVGTEISLADIAIWSSLKQVEQAKNAAANIARWIETCSSLPQFKLALSLVI